MPTKKPTAVVTPASGNATPAKARTVTKTGNLTREWELAYSANGKAYARGSLAVNGWGEHKGETEFYNLVAFGSLAENLSECTSKGDRLIVSGKPQIREWDAADGTKRSSKEIIVNDAGAELRFCTVEIITPERFDSTTTQQSWDLEDDEAPF